LLKKKFERFDKLAANELNLNGIKAPSVHLEPIEGNAEGVPTTC